MSGVNISYEIASSGGSIKYYEDSSLCSKTTPNLANVIAGEIVNEILENALDIATRASDTGIHWKEIKESRSHHRTTMNQSHINESDSKNVKQKMNESHRENMCSNIVGDIVEHIGIPSEPDISEIIDSLNSITVNQDAERDKQDALTIDIEMQKLLAEMLGPSHQAVNFDNLPANCGIGDQPTEIPENISNEAIAQPEIPRTIEKKSRVTDLVKNSPRIISEYLMMDELAKQNQEEWEESSEQVLQVIELDHVKVGEEQFRVQKSVYPEEVPLPDGDDDDDDEDEIPQMPSDDLMDVIDLSTNAFKEEERQLSSTNENSNGAKGDDKKNENLVFNARPCAAASSGGEAIAANQKHLVGTQSNALVEQQKSKKKKCNLGTRIWGFLKKGHKQSSSASTEKPV